MAYCRTHAQSEKKILTEALTHSNTRHSLTHTLTHTHTLTRTAWHIQNAVWHSSIYNKSFSCNINHTHTAHTQRTHSYTHSFTHSQTLTLVHATCIFLTHNCLFSSGLTQCTHTQSASQLSRRSQRGSRSPYLLPLPLPPYPTLHYATVPALCLSLAFVNWCPSVLCFNYAQLVPNNGDALAAACLPAACCRSPALNDDAK